MWRPFAVDLAICVRRTFELPFVEPQLLGRAPGGFGVEHAIVRDDALEAIGVAENPVNHVAAVTGTQRALAVLVDEGIGFLSIIEAEHQIFEGSAAPIAVDGVNEFLPISGRAMEVDHDDDVSVGGEQRSEERRVGKERRSRWWMVVEK